MWLVGDFQSCRATNFAMGSEKMKLGRSVLAALSFIAASCSPVYSVKRYGVTVTLNDLDTTEPIAAAPVVLTIDGDAFSETADRKGKVFVAPDLRYQVSWLGGPAIQSDPEARIQIVCRGYHPVAIEWFRHFPDRNAGIQEDGGVIDLGKLSLTRTKSQEGVRVGQSATPPLQR